MRRLCPQTALEQMETLQTALYAEGKDVLNLEALKTLLPALGIDAERCFALLEDPALEAAVTEEMETALDILDEFPVYPTLFLERGSELIPLTRGYAPYPTVRAKLDNALAGIESTPTYMEGAACGLDGNCC